MVRGPGWGRGAGKFERSAGGLSEAGFRRGCVGAGCVRVRPEAAGGGFGLGPPGACDVGVVWRMSGAVRGVRAERAVVGGVR